MIESSIVELYMSLLLCLPHLRLTVADLFCFLQGIAQHSYSGPRGFWLHRVSAAVLVSGHGALLHGARLSRSLLQEANST